MTTARKFHLVFGIALSLLYLFLFSHLHRILPGLEFISSPSPIPVTDSPGFGWLIAFGLPIIAIACFVAPDRFMRWFSPRICGFRPMPAPDSGACRATVPVDAGPVFRPMPG